MNDQRHLAAARAAAKPELVQPSPRLLLDTMTDIIAKLKVITRRVNSIEGKLDHDHKVLVLLHELLLSQRNTTRQSPFPPPPEPGMPLSATGKPADEHCGPGPALNHRPWRDRYAALYFDDDVKF